MSCNHGETIRDRAIAVSFQLVGTAAGCYALLHSSRSLALIAELGHFIGDFLPGAIGLVVAMSLHQHHAHVHKHPGFDIATLVNAWSLIAAGLWSWIETILSMRHNHHVVNFHVALPVAIICFACNGIGAWRAFVQRHAAIDFWEYGKHLMADTVLSLFILLSILGAYISHFTFIDTFGAIVVGAWMIWYGWTSRAARRAWHRLRIHRYRRDRSEDP